MAIFVVDWHSRQGFWKAVAMWEDPWVSLSLSVSVQGNLLVLVHNWRRGEKKMEKRNRVVFGSHFINILKCKTSFTGCVGFKEATAITVIINWSRTHDAEMGPKLITAESALSPTLLQFSVQWGSLAFSCSYLKNFLLFSTWWSGPPLIQWVPHYHHK